MAPVHDTDLGEERWVRDQWRNFELWEKIEIRLKRKKRVWIWSTVVLFVLLSSVPVLMDRWPRWRAQNAVRKLADEINWIKKQAALDHYAYRIRFEGRGSLFYSIEKSRNCHEGGFQPVKTGVLLGERTRGQFLLIPPERGQDLRVPGLTETFCYDFARGGFETKDGELMAFAIAPVKDLTNTTTSEERISRISLLLVQGPTAELSFN